MKKASDSNYGLLMKGLIYPAVLGAGIVWFLMFLANYVPVLSQSGEPTPIVKDLRLYFSIWLLLYFCVSFLILETENFPNGYGFCVFFTDVIDVVVIFVVFLSLGLVTQTSEINYPWLYGGLALIPVLAFAGKRCSGREVHKALSIALFVLSAVMAAGLHAFILANVIALTILYILLACYFYKIFVASD